MLIVARVVQGIGGALFPLSFGIIRDEFAPSEVSGSISNLSAVIAAGGGVGMVAAGPIVTALDYRWLFWLPVGIVALTTLIALRYVPSRPAGPRGASTGSAPSCCRAGWWPCSCRSARRAAGAGDRAG